MIEIENVSKLFGFGGAATIALDEVSLEINEGEFLGIMGPSGCGKSTLMNIIGLLDKPTHGTYRLSGRNVARLRPGQRAKIRRDRIGFVFQSFNLLPRLNVIENVALPLAYKGMSTSKRLKEASAMLERIGLADREYYMPSQLSGGQMQSVAIARALINDPPLIIADEPTGNLDSAASRLVMELLGEVHASGTTVLLVTHNPELTRYAKRVVYMHDGSIIHDEKTEQGEVAPTARRVLYFLPRTTEEDDLAGVSALMKAIPVAEKETEKVPSKKKKTTAKSKRRKKSSSSSSRRKT